MRGIIEKQGRIKLRGKALRDLNDAVFDRDNHCCIACGAWVPDGQKFHHYPYGPDKSDEINKAVLLCYSCHDKAHFSDPRRFADICREYLMLIYG